MSEKGLEVGRRGPREGAQGSNPTHQGLMLEETSCPDRAYQLKALGPSGGLWLPLCSLSLVQGVVLLAQTRG